MTSAALPLAGPTRFERGLQALAAALTRHVDRRVALRVQRRELELELLRERRSRMPDPRALDPAILSLGARPFR